MYLRPAEVGRQVRSVFFCSCVIGVQMPQGSFPPSHVLLPKFPKCLQVATDAALHRRLGTWKEGIEGMCEELQSSDGRDANRESGKRERGREGRKKRTGKTS